MTRDPLSIVVCPHSMELGGSQLNAIELAAATQELGHRLLVYARDGELVDRVRDLGLDYVEAVPSRIQPGPAKALDLRRVVRDRDVDVLHGYEWPPILECWAAATSSRRPVAPVGTVMSMAVAPFVPAALPLVVGTARIQEHEQARRSGPVHLIEPPIDTRANRPGAGGQVFAEQHPSPPGTLQVVIVSRLVPELKLEGVLTAVRAVGRLSRSRQVRLVVVGDGSARSQVAALADEVNRETGREVVLVPGPMADPRAAYDAADVCLGMGGSALRALAFEKPLVVQGEGGFFEILSRETVDAFLEQGWYGVGDLDPAAACDRLTDLLRTLVDDPALRQRLGTYGRGLVESRFGLEAAARTQESIYREALATGGRRRTAVRDAARSGVGLGRYRVERRWQRWRGSRAVDDFNARPV